jgi:hypothetical protein
MKKYFTKQMKKAIRYKERSENGGCKMTQKKVYDKELKIQPVKLGREIGLSKGTGSQYRYPLWME